MPDDNTLPLPPLVVQPPPEQSPRSTVNPYFNNYYAENEQGLLEGLIIDSIKAKGLEVLYIPRKYINLDRFYGDDKLSSFEKAYPIEMHIHSYDSYQGDGDFLSKFGLEIRNEMTLNVSIRRFGESVQTPHLAATGTDLIRPREGDLIWFGLDNRLFEITFAEKRSVFFQLGNLFMYMLKCKEFELSSETIQTGVLPVDRVEDDHDYTLDIALTSGFGTYIPGEPVNIGDGFSAVVSLHNEGTSTLTVIRPNTTLPASGNAVGAISGATYTISGTDTKNIKDALLDNDYVADSGVVVNTPNMMTS